MTPKDIKLLSKLPGKKKRGRPKKPEGAPISHHKKPKKTKKEVAAEKAAKEAAAAAAASGGQNSEGAARESVDSQDSGNSNSQQQYPQPTQNHQVGVHQVGACKKCAFYNHTNKVSLWFRKQQIDLIL